MVTGFAFGFSASPVREEEGTRSVLGPYGPRDTSPEWNPEKESAGTGLYPIFRLASSSLARIFASASALCAAIFASVAVS